MGSGLNFWICSDRHFILLLSLIIVISVEIVGYLCYYGNKNIRRIVAASCEQTLRSLFRVKQRARESSANTSFLSDGVVQKSLPGNIQIQFSCINCPEKISFLPHKGDFSEPSCAKSESTFYSLYSKPNAAVGHTDFLYVLKSQLSLFKTKQRPKMYIVSHLAKAHG